VTFLSSHKKAKEEGGNDTMEAAESLRAKG